MALVYENERISNSKTYTISNIKASDFVMVLWTTSPYNTPFAVSATNTRGQYGTMSVRGQIVLIQADTDGQMIVSTTWSYADDLRINIYHIHS